MNFDDLFYYLNYGRTRKQKKRKMPHAVLELPHRANVTTNHSLAVRKL